LEEKLTEIELAKLTPEERLARNVIHGAHGYCHFDVAVRPARLMPGQTGTVSVTMILEGDAVMPCPAKLSLLGAGGAPALTFGEMSIDPPGNVRLAKGYQGQPVYDNWAIAQLPVTMAAGLPFGSKQAGSLDLTFDLYNGTTTQPIGRFNDRVNFTIEVGQSPEPAVAMRGPGSEQPPASRDQKSKPSAPQHPGAEPDKKVTGAVDAK